MVILSEEHNTGIGGTYHNLSCTEQYGKARYKNSNLNPKMIKINVSNTKKPPNSLKMKSRPRNELTQTAQTAKTALHVPSKYTHGVLQPVLYACCGIECSYQSHAP